MTEPMTSREALLEQNRKDALEFCKGAFRPFVNDVRQYTDIVATLLDNATNRALLSPAQAQSTEPVQDTWLVGGPDLKAMSGSVESDRVIQLHFRRPATDADRKWLLEAINAKIAADATSVPSTDCAIDIPEGVYFSAEASNFYHVETKRGCGNEFYRIWKDHWRAFPQSAAAVSSNQGKTP